MLVFNRTAPPDSKGDLADRRNEIVITLPDGRRVTVFLHTKYTTHGGSRLRVVIDAPRDVLVDRGEVADAGRSVAGRLPQPPLSGAGSVVAPEAVDLCVVQTGQ